MMMIMISGSFGTAFTDLNLYQTNCALAFVYFSSLHFFVSGYVC